MAASSAARSWDVPAVPDAPSKKRTWAETVPYDIIDETADAPELAPPAARGRRAPAPPSTGRLYAVPGGRPETAVYRPERPALPALEAPHPAPGAGGLRLPAGAATASTARMALYGLGAALTAVVLYLVVSTVITWTQARIDDVVYGNPRTTQLDAVVGHNDSPANPTHFIAINLHRQISVLELPGGDISKAVAITGPYLFGDGEDLTPVHLQLSDMNADGKPDLVVTVKNEELVYINDKGGFRPITDAEKAALEQAPPPASTAGQ